MSQAFYTGISGMRGADESIRVISDNLANTSTVGFKGYSTEFSNFFEKAINTNSQSSSVDSSVGVGSRVSSVVMDESIGAFQATQSSTDMAILGDGWFGVQGNGNTLYTRDGGFTFDANRDFVTRDGYFVLGTMGNNIADGVLTPVLNEVALGDVEAQQKLTFPNDLYFPPVATSTMDISGNLSLINNIQTISSPVITSTGQINNLRIQYTKSAVQVSPGVQWDISASVESINTSEIYSTGTGVITFNDNGELTSNTLTSIDNQGSNVSINMGSGFDGLISIDAPQSATSVADGLDDGELLGYDTNKNGDIVATFTNGQQSAVGKIAIFHFANDRGLERAGSAKFYQNANSGDAIFFKDANGNNILGTDLITGQLEGSNVRLEQGLTDIIIMQRAFDANSKSITTADQMLQKALQMGA